MKLLGTTQLKELLIADLFPLNFVGFSETLVLNSDYFNNPMVTWSVKYRKSVLAAKMLSMSLYFTRVSPVAFAVLVLADYYVD